MDQRLDLANKDFNAAILHKELKENTLKTLKNICSLMCKQREYLNSRKIKTTKKAQKGILRVKNIITK